MFSVIIPTRNRSSLFAVALQSVLEQRFRDFEVIVVNDGSSDEYEPHYRELVACAQGMARMLTLVRTEHGHGPSFARNYGANQANGEYLCFLDDDDQWIDPEHLGRAARVITAEMERPDMVLANQRAFRNDAPVSGPIWIEDLKDHLHCPPGATGAYSVSPAILLLCQAHCHLNTTIVSRALFFEINGFDAALRYEEDRDFYLRAIDRARSIRFIPNTVSRHNIPDPAEKGSMSTVETELSKRLYQLRVFDKAVLFSTRPEIRRYAMRQRTYILKHIATETSRVGRLDCAAYYAKEALLVGFNLGWLGLTVLFGVRRLAQGRRARSK